MWLADQGTQRVLQNLRQCSEELQRKLVGASAPGTDGEWRASIWGQLVLVRWMLEQTEDSDV